MLGGLRPQYRKLYEGSLQAIKKHLHFRPMTEGDHDILFSGHEVFDEDKHVDLEREVQHLACFVGGMIGIGAQIFDSPDDFKIARALVDGCDWAYERMVTGIMPEVFHVLPCTEPGPCRWDQQRWHSAIPDTTTNSSSNEYPSEAHVIQEDRLQSGITSVEDRRYILR